VPGVEHEELVDFFVMSDGDAEDVFSETLDGGLDVVGCFPEGGANLVGGLLADVGLKEHLHGQLTGFAAGA
jgi:hypothetical protein